MWTKMSKSGTAICSLVGLLGLIAAILGFVAEAKHVRAGEVEMTPSRRCLYPRSPALALGITAAVALLLAQIIVNSVVGCICCSHANRYPPSPNRTIAIICLVVSWITFSIAFILLMAGAALNDKHNADLRTFGDYCYVVKSGVFAGGAVLALATVTLGIIYFITASAAKSSSECSPQNPNIAMAEPQYGRSNMQPVFVPEQYDQYGQYPQYSRGFQQPSGPRDNNQRPTWR